MFFQTCNNLIFQVYCSLTRRFQEKIKECPHIILGVGPVSLNCVDTSIAAAHHLDVPLLFVASRRQIEMSDLGGGYVNNWTTETFAEYVRAQDKQGLIFLERDHGGPWQNEIECTRRYNTEDAMASAKRSFEADILAGFDILHIDPNIADPGGSSISFSLYAERTKELYLHCYEFAEKNNKNISFEIATDEREIGDAPEEETKDFVLDILDFCASEKIPKPDFVVIQTGAKVMETLNVGPFEKWISQDGKIPDEHAFHQLSKLCRANNILVKVHNADYLPVNSISWHSKERVDSVNVAPEFGVAESKAFLATVDNLGRQDLEDRFIKLVLESGKWKKWMLPGTTADDRQKALIAGHYIFASPEYIEIKAEASAACSKNGLDLNQEQYNAVYDSIMRYLSIFSR